MKKTIDQEIEEMAESLEKSVKTPEDSILELAKSLGKDEFKVRVAALNTEDKELLKSVLSKAVEMDDQYQAKFVQGNIKDTIIQEDKADDDQDEKLVKPEAAKMNHQGTPTEGWEGQVIKAEKPEKEDKKEEAKEKAAEKIMSMEEKQHGTKDPKKLVEAEKKEHSMKKSEEQPEDLEKGRGPDKSPRKKRSSDGNMRAADAMVEMARKKGLIKSDEKAKMAKSEIFKSLEDASEASDEEVKELLKGKMKMLAEEAQLGDAPEMSESTRAKKQKMEDQVENDEANKMAQKKVNDMSQGKMSKSISWNPEDQLLKANTQGRNHHFSVNGYYDEVLAKSEEKPEVETLEKSEKQEDLNDIIEKGETKSWYDVQKEAHAEEMKKSQNGTLFKSFQDNEIAAALGLTEEEAKELLGE